jgi:serine kinase of HPr protein (carbohydrate metabolism regulator)
MDVKELVDKLNLIVVAGADGLNRQITGGYSSDLLSDVMGHADAGMVWVTLQTHKNVMVKGYQPDPDMLQQAIEEGIPVLSTRLAAFEINGQIYNLIKA